MSLEIGFLNKENLTLKPIMVSGGTLEVIVNGHMQKNGF